MSTYKSPSQIAEDEGYSCPFEYLEDTGIGFDSIVPACCTHGCDVEPDGTCPHNQPSILLKLGAI